MDKKNYITTGIIIIAGVLMFNFLNGLFGQSEDEAGLSEKIAQGAFLVDVRTPEEVAMGTVDGSVNIPLDRLRTRLREFDGKETIVVFCRSGNRSAQAKYLLEQAGYKNVINGGTWQNVRNQAQKAK
jgi:rhodanese-related sulfurtransferase